MTKHSLTTDSAASCLHFGIDACPHATPSQRAIPPLNKWAGQFLLAPLMAIASLTSASAHDFSVGDIKIGHPWTRATPGGAKVAGGYITIENSGAKPDRLIGGTMEASGRVELHEMSVTDGIMRMRELPTGVVVHAGGRVEMKPGGYHIMFFDLQRPLKQGEKVAGTLVFESAGAVKVEFQVDAMGSPGSHGGHPN